MTNNRDEIINKAIGYIVNGNITPYKIAKNTKLSEKTVGNYKNGVTKPTLANAETIIRYFEGDNGVYNERVSSMITPTPYTTYLLPMSAMGGSLTGFANDCATLHNCEAIVSPIENVDFAITVYGESMAPEYPSGSRVLIKKFNPDLFIDWGRTYVLDTPNGVIIKEVHESEKPGYIRCNSINPDPKFKPFDVPLSEVFGMYKVLMCLAMK